MSQITARFYRDKPTFTFQPGGVASGNVYNDWATLYAALSASNGPRVVSFDDSISPVVIPAGSYDFSDVLLQGGNPVSGFAAVEVADGVTFTNFRRSKLVRFTFLNTATVETLSNANDLIILENSDVTANGTVPIWDFAVTAQGISIDKVSNIFTGAVPAINAQAGVVVNLYLISFGNVFSNTLAGDPTSTFVFVVISTAANYSNTQAGYTGTITTFLLTNAPNLKYDPTTPGDWSVVPTNVQQALDTLAATPSGGGGNAVIFQDGGVDSGIIYSTWAGALAAAQAMQISTIYVDDSLVAPTPAAVPAGSYDLTGITLANGNPASFARIDFAAETTLANFNNVQGHLLCTFNNTVAPIEAVNDVGREIHINGGSVSNNGTQPIWDISAAGTSIYMELEAQISGASAVVNLQGGSQLSIEMFEASSVSTDVISGAVGSNLFVDRDDSTSFSSQSGFAGTFSEFFYSNNAAISFGSTIGTATLVAGTVSVAYPTITASHQVQTTILGTPSAVTTGFHGIVITPGVGFDINSSNVADVNDVQWVVLNP